MALATGTQIWYPKSMFEQEFELRHKTGPDWQKAVYADFEAFLRDHTACERKASAMALALVMQYPNKSRIIEPLIRFAKEELDHFHLMSQVLIERGIFGASDEKDPYIGYLKNKIRPEKEARLLDKLLMGAVVEARGFERLSLITQTLTEPRLKKLYEKITLSEGGHRMFFVKMAQHYFDDRTIADRLSDFLRFESEAIQSVPIRAAVH